MQYYLFWNTNSLDVKNANLLWLVGKQNSHRKATDNIYFANEAGWHFEFLERQKF